MIQTSELAALQPVSADSPVPTPPSDMASHDGLARDCSDGSHTGPDRARQILGDVLRDAVLPRLIAQARDRL